MSGISPGVTVNTSEKNQSGNDINNEKNFMDEEYFMRQYADNRSPFISPAEKARLQEKEYKRQFENNEREMNEMLTNALEHNVLFFNSEEYEILVNNDKFLRKKLNMPLKKSYYYPPSFFQRLSQRCRGGKCEKVEVLVPPQKPGYYPKRKQRKANTRKSNTRKSNTRKSNTRKRSNF